MTSYAFTFANTSLRATDTRARFLDSAIRVPGTSVRSRADALLNLIPGGTLSSKAMSADLAWEMHRVGVPVSTLLYVADNVGVDCVISAIPAMGWVDDVFLRSNLRNMAMLREHLDQVSPVANRLHG